MSTESQEPSNALVSRLDEPQLPMTTPHDLLSLAVSKGATIDVLMQLMDLQDRYDAKQAKNAYTEAMAEFKKNPPEILKRKLVSFENRTGQKTEYRHAEIGDVCDAVVAALGRSGFSHGWKITQDAKIEVTCIITHRLGHSESVTMKSAPDNSGGKNDIQAVASTVTYLERYTLLAAVGLATNSMDDDGRGSELKTITEEQEIKLRDLAEDVEADMPKFLAYMKVGALSGIAAKDYHKAESALKAKAKTQGKANG